MEASRTPPAPAAPAAGPRQPPPAPAPVSRARRAAAPALTLAGVVAAFAYVGAVDPNEPGHYPVCPMLRLTGILCPGCGGLRSAHAFAQGDLVTALGANAAAVAGYVVLAGFLALWLVRAFRGGPVPRIVLRPVYWWGIGGLALIFAIVRNLPFGSALAP
ncbi:DUF2752 domain-containing protein [Streptomyces sp. NBC_00249]|uniref:DUF2752 domain-containing protein n=1 Tax=Streptomyces sp. NBC_00249 TaxID=2975690 RepID=UPI00225A8C27|nr:DUF2752 domain-containing protein [Streptomyces sp. NBC_00249]MCX5196739.1 DUF2752 domain-containing protein [Streptomyces sp. NBC_00249]